MGQAVLVLENGRVFRGTSFGHTRTVVGEVVFNTSMTGYQEVLTDPSYRGQIVVMTNPQIGNTGVNPQDAESDRIWVEGLVVRELSPVVSSWRANCDLSAELSKLDVPGLTGIDTRALTRELRVAGALGGVLTTSTGDLEKAAATAKAHGSMVGRNLVGEVSCRAAYPWTDSGADWLGELPAVGQQMARPRVVAYDLGIKRNILRMLVRAGVEVQVVPASTTAADVLALHPDGVFLSNGPGDPAAVTGVIGEIGKLLGRVPIFGICLGHQLAALALGGRTFKLKFGHHGGNHPVRDESTGRVEITSQNHGFAVDPESLPAGARPSHWNLNDGTLEGFRHDELQLLTCQHHPEASPGPHDSHYLFQNFVDLMAAHRGSDRAATD